MIKVMTNSPNVNGTRVWYWMGKTYLTETEWLDAITDDGWNLVSVVYVATRNDPHFRYYLQKN